MGTLPTQLDPRTLALTMGLTPGAPPRDITAANVAAPPPPTAAPQGAAPTGDPMAALMAQYQTSAQRAGQLTEKGLQTGEQIAATPQAIPWAPSFRPIHGVGDFFHDLLQGVLAAGAATRPGALVKEMIERPEQYRRAQAIQGLQAKEATEEKGAETYGKLAEAAGRLGYEQGILGVRRETADAAMKRAKA